MNVLNLNWSTGDDSFSGGLSIIVAFITYFMPLFIVLFVFFMKSKVSQDIVRARFGSLYEGIRTDSIACLLSNFFFTSRRLVLILVTVNWTDYPAFQVMAYIFLSNFNIVYILNYKPFETRETNLIELFNEACILATSYIIILFSDFNDSP